MKTIALIAALAPLALVAACSAEPEAAPVEPVATPAAQTPTLPAPDQALFTELFAKACPEAEKVNTAVCKRAGLGSPEVACEFGLGEDKYLREKATLAATDGAWAIKDAAAVCKQHSEHHAG